MIVCHRCGKENQDHYKFCLGCGAELTRAAAAPEGKENVAMMKTMMADIGSSPLDAKSGGQPAGRPDPGSGARPLPGVGSAPGQPGQPQAGPPGQPLGGPAGQPPGPPRSAPPGVGKPPPTHPPAGPPPGVPTAGTPAVSPPVEHLGEDGTRPGGPIPGVTPASGPHTCPSCGSTVPSEFKFCGVCGSKMEGAPAAEPRTTADMAQQPAEQAQAAHGMLTLIRPDGSEGGTHPLNDGENTLGRDHGDIFENDGYLSPTHCELVLNAAGAVVRDLDSLNGVFVKMTEEEELEPGQVIRIGQELLRFDLIEPPEPLEDGTEIMGSPNPGYWGKITVIIGDDVDGSAYPLLGDSVTLGRERGEINFPDDGYVSGLHARLSTRDGKVFLADLGSSNGTFIKVQGERELGNESFVLLGQQLFRLNM